MQTALREENRAYVQIDPAEAKEGKEKMIYHVQFPGLGLDLTVNRVALSIGGFNIYWYGVIIAAGMMLAMLYAFRNAVDYGIDSDRLVDVVAIGAVMSIVCARIYYVAMAPFEYQSMWEMVDIRKGGIAIYGAVLGAFVFGALAAKWRKVPLLPLFDLVSLGFLIGQGIGRWGNFVNQEAFGTNTTLPWGHVQRRYRGVSQIRAGHAAGRHYGGSHGTGASHISCMKASGVWLASPCWLRFTKNGGSTDRSSSVMSSGTALAAHGSRGCAPTRCSSAARGCGPVSWWRLGRSSWPPRLWPSVCAMPKGQAAVVPLAVRDLKKQAEAGGPLHAGHPARRRPHAEFVKATDAMNARLDALDLNEVEIEEIEDPKE